MPPLIDRASVERLYHRADAARWELSIEDFARALQRSVTKAFADRTPSARDVQRYVDSLRHADLALACACAAGHEAAWDHFVLEYRPVLYRAADALDPSGGARELADSLYADLFGLETDASLFRYFHGRSSLATWLRAVLAQRLVDRVRAGARTAPLPDEEPATPTNQVPDPDRSRYLTLIHKALGEAIANLDARARLRIRYYYVQRLTLADTGRLLGEHEASVSRHLSAARKAIRRDVERRLSASGLAREEIAQCFACVAEDAGPLDLDRLLSSASDARESAADVQSEEASAFAPTIGVGRKRQ
ncbi:MAG: sigma-70 family RNA polymerase sigma factor [Vicinamibacterales bacterium]